MSLETPSCDDRPIWNIWLSVYWMPAVTAADELGLFDALQDRAGTADELAERLQLNPSAMRAMLPMMASLDLLSVQLGRYQLTELSRTYLLKEGPFYWGHAFAIYRASPTHQNLVAALKAGPAGVGGVKPADAWERGEMDPEMARSVGAFMHSHSLPAAVGLAQGPHFAGVRRLLDVGGGTGCFSIALAQRHPSLHCTIMELPAVCDLARDYIAAAGVAGQVDAVSVDMFRQAWPTGYDGIFMSNVFHDWDVETCAKLAASAFEALPAGGTLFLHEMLMADDGSGPRTAAAFSMMMLVGTQGRQYSLGELRGILTGAGFEDVQAREAAGFYSLVTGTKGAAA